MDNPHVAAQVTFFRLMSSLRQFSRRKGEVGFGGFERHPETPQIKRHVVSVW
jgi:hypothetical protein